MRKRLKALHGVEAGGESNRFFERERERERERMVFGRVRHMEEW